MTKKKKEIKRGESEKKEPRKFREYSFPPLPPGSPFGWNRWVIAVNLKRACEYMGLK